jgi:hypothetical protein
MNKVFTKVIGIGSGLTMLGMLIAPQLSSAQVIANTQVSITAQVLSLMCNSIDINLARVIQNCQGLIIRDGGMMVAAGGNTSSQSSYDTIAPSPTGFSAGGIYNAGGTLSWTTSEPSSTMAWYRSNSMAGGTLIPIAGSSALTTNHTISLSGLQSNGQYSVIVGGRDASGNLGYSSSYPFNTNTLSQNQSFNPQVSVMNVGNGGATIQVSGSQPVRAEVSYGVPGSTMVRASTNTTYGTNYNVDLTGLSAGSSYNGMVTIYDQSGNVIGTSNVNWNQ